MGRRKYLGRKPGTGKAQRKLTAYRVRYYARLGFSKSGMARALDISIDSVNDIFKARPEIAAAWATGLTDKEEKLRKLQWRHAAKSVPMTIHLSAHQLGEHNQSLVVHKPDDEAMTMLDALFKVIDGTGRGLPDPAKIRPAIEYSPADTITVAPSPPNGPGGTMATLTVDTVREAKAVARDQPLPEAPEEICEQPPARDLVMPPRMKSLLPDFES
jgi:hypothetical protein